jgi:hypothetical protein
VARGDNDGDGAHDDGNTYYDDNSMEDICAKGYNMEDNTPNDKVNNMVNILYEIQL